MEIPARVYNQPGEVMMTGLLDISLGGLRLAADSALIAHIEGEGDDGNRIVPHEFRVEFTLPGGAETPPVALHCRLVYKRRLSQHSYQIGLKTLEFDGESEAMLRRYITSNLP